MRVTLKIQTSLRPAVLFAATLLMPAAVTFNAIAAAREAQVCDVDADQALGQEDYPLAIRLHINVLRLDPNNALAHYHLGFAQGMEGNGATEINEFRRAEALGLENWDLFLNLGLAQLEKGDLDAATDSLRTAVLLGDEHSESHLNLAVVEERRGMLADAERETLSSLRLNRKQPDARNLLGVIYAQEGKTTRASRVWRELVSEVPDYQPARTNLALLDSQSEVVLGEDAVAPPFLRPPSKPSNLRANLRSKESKYGGV